MITIRRATTRDADAIARLPIDGWRTAYRGLLPRRVLDGCSPRERAETWRRVLQDEDPSSVGVVLVAETDGSALGFVHFGPVREERADPAGATAEVYEVAVARERLSTGVGRELMRDAVELMRDEGHRQAVLWVLRGNMRARRFHERGGWVPDGAERVSRDAPGIPSVRYRLPITVR